MAETSIHQPTSIFEALELKRLHKHALFFAGGTTFFPAHEALASKDIILLGKVPDLKKTALNERFLHLGAGLTLSQILQLKISAVPDLLRKSIKSIGNAAVRNLATIGGNIACPNALGNLWPALACLDARVEIREGAGTSWHSMTRLIDENGKPDFPKSALAVRVRIPVEQGEIAVFRKFETRFGIREEAVKFAFTAKVANERLVDFNMAFAGVRAVFISCAMTNLAGKPIPLSSSENASFFVDLTHLASRLETSEKMIFAVLAQSMLDFLTVG